jgi:hypothetical protein
MRRVENNLKDKRHWGEKNEIAEEMRKDLFSFKLIFIYVLLRDFHDAEPFLTI